MRFGMIGDSYTARSGSVADEECINQFLETRNGSKSYFYTPGLEIFGGLFGATVVRGITIANGRVFAVGSGQLFGLAIPNSSGAVFAPLGAVADDGNAVSMASNGLQLFVVSGGRAYCFDLGSEVLTDETSKLAAIPQQVQYSDSYFIVTFRNSNKFQVSGILDGTSWPGVQVNAVSVFPEDIASIIVNHRELWVFGTRHAQPYQNTGSVEVFDVIPGSFIEVGAVGPGATCLVDNSIFWVSEDDRGGRMAWRSNGYVPTRISTYAVEIDLASYPTLVGMTTYSYQDGGHTFWVLYIPGSSWSWCFDVGEGAWHKRASWNPDTATWGPHNSWNHVYAYGLHLVGDWAAGYIYAMSQNQFVDVSTKIRRYRRAPILEDEMEWIRHAELTLDFDMGNLSIVSPTDKPTLAASLYGFNIPFSAVDTPIGGAVWDHPEYVMANDGRYATGQLTAVVQTSTSSTATGTTTGGGVAWASPENIDDPVSYTTVTLAAGGTPIEGATGSIGNAATPSNQTPVDNWEIIGNFPSTAATDATLYVVINGSIVANAGGGVLSLYYSIDSGATWLLAGSNNATFPSVTISIPLSGLTNLNTVKVKVNAACSCSPSGFSNVLITVTRMYAILAGSSQPISQTLAAAVSGLTLPAGMTLVGLGLSFTAEYSGDAPTFNVGLSVGNVIAPSTITSSPATYIAGGSNSLWGYDAWTAATFSSLAANFTASSTGSTVVSVNNLVWTIYYTQTTISTDALDITEFGFTVPSTATPEGVIPVIRAYANVTGGELIVQLLKAGVPTGATRSLPLSTIPTVMTYGGLNDLFEATLDSADVDAVGFGIRLIGSTSSGASVTIYAGYTTLQVYAPAPFNQTYTGPNPNLTDGNGNPRPPQVMVRWSDDRGKTWSNEHIVDCGNLGEYRARAILRRLGRSRYRVYEISMTDPVPWVMVDGYLKAEK